MRAEASPIEKMLKASNGSVYKLTILLAKRSLELATGDRPLIDKPTEKSLENALQEILADKVKVKG